VNALLLNKKEFLAKEVVLKQIICNHIWACKTMAGSAIISKRKDFLNRHFQMY
jgi:hypothetical protein